MRAPLLAQASLLPAGLAAFAAGVVLLQWQPVLPASAPWLGAAALAAILAAALHGFARRSNFVYVAVAA